MMKNIIYFLFIVMGASVVAQTQSRFIEVPWETNTPVFNNVSAFAKKGDNSNKLTSLGLEVSQFSNIFQTNWVDQGFAAPNSLQITNIQYAAVQESESQIINKNLVKSSVNGKISTSRGRDAIRTTLTISPIIYRNGQYQKVVSFQLRYNYGRASSGTRMPIANSVLETGDWFRFKIEKTGVYKVDYNFLQNLGMNIENLDPRNLKIFGMGGKPLRLKNQDNAIFDLPENSIKVIGEQDGSFDEGDYILFYGIGVEGYDPENDTHLNPFSDETYYFVTASGGPGLRIQPMTEPSGTANVIFDEFNTNQFIEEDLFSPAKVGRQWFGSKFDVESQQSFEFEIPNIVPGTEVVIKVRAAAASEVATSMAVNINGTAINPLIFGSINDPTLLSVSEATNTISASGEAISVDLNYNNAGNPASDAYLDYISINAVRGLVGMGEQMSFANESSADPLGVAEYQVGNASQFSEVWDVTQFNEITSKANEGSASSFSFKANTGFLRKYVAVHPSDYYNPIDDGDAFVPNQDLKGTILKDASGNFVDVDYLIVTAPFLIQPALRLAQHRAQVSGMNVKVVTLDKIYNEFSSGIQDVGAIRNFVRYIYENASSPDKRIKYLCLFGDTSVDYKNRLANNNNIVPTYHTVSSVSTFTSFMTDDYFVCLDPTEGDMDKDTAADLLDLSVGRIVADNVSLANAMVDKIVEYDTKASYGNWRNNFVLISDDVDKENEYLSLEVTLDSIGDRVTAEKPYINVKKIHSDAFQQETSAGGDRYPDVNEAIIQAVEVGSLVVNYFGHGGEDGMASEFIYTKDIAQNLENENRYPLLVTVTCELSKFDNPLRVTAGELTFWNRTGGAVSLITTTRSIGILLGVEFNQILSEYLFGFGQDIPVPPSEALLLAKNGISNNNKRVIFFIGDPAMPLSFPKQSVRITHLNDQPIGQATDTLKALSKVRFRGEVVGPSGNLLNNYNGVVEAKIFDKDVQRQTLGNDGIRNSAGELLILNFKTLGEILFNGQASVNNGIFEFEFVVPRDIQIPVGNGKVSLYSSKNEALEDQTGFNLDILVGGINENAPEDTQGPLINLFMNDESFVSGGITNDSPFLIAKLEDENGINTASGIGHDIVGILDGDEANPFVLNEYYQAAVDDYTRGEVVYKLRDLEEGPHTLTLKAWDVYNNSSTMDIQFIVAGDDQLEITRVLNYPNPFVNYTEFWFNHNRPFEPLEVQVQVFTVTGKVVWTQNQIVNTDGFLSREIVWNGKDDFGDAIGKGVYVYKLTVKSSLTGQQVEKFEKLVIL